MDRRVDNESIEDATFKIIDGNRQESLEAFQFIEQVLAEQPDNVEALYARAVYKELYLEDYAGATSDYEKILSLEPDNKAAKDGIQSVQESIKLHEEIEEYQNHRAFTGSDTSLSINLDWLNAWYIVFFKAVILFILLYMFYPYLLFGFADSQLPKTYDIDALNPQKLTINSPMDYNGLTKKQVYDIRKKFVRTSLFSSDNYQPNEAVFGGIVDGKPWWGINQIVCSEYNNPNFDRISGLSSVSKHVNNPNELVGTVFPFNFFKEYDEIGYCTAEYAKTIPTELLYIKDKNLIIAKYKMDKRVLSSYLNWNGSNRHYFLNLTGLNARDLGYKYAYAIDLKNIKMTEDHNFSKNLCAFRDFIHVGSSCKVEGGCNNISPHQTELDYRPIALPAEFTIKLWKKKPINPYVKADFYYRIVFEAI